MDKNRFKHYTTGIDFIDVEHWEMFELLNKVEEFRKTDPIKAQMYLRHFKDVSHRHTMDEYNMMKQIGFPYAHVHETVHNTECLKVDCFLGDKLLPAEFDIRNLQVRDLISYLAKHIDEQDMQYVPFYKAWKEENLLKEKHGS
jgi:hemerythrin-like metal-binding protein